MGLLQHLKSYKRVTPPSDVENTYLLENGLLPDSLSNTRLPFHLLMQSKHYWKIICELIPLMTTVIKDFTQVLPVQDTAFSYKFSGRFLEEIFLLRFWSQYFI